MSRPDTAVLVPVADLTDVFEGMKVRTVGSLSCSQPGSGRAELWRDTYKVQVDLSLAMQGLQMGSLSAHSKVMVFGSMERRGEALILIAIHASLVDDLDIALWEQAARELSRALHNRRCAG